MEVGDATWVEFHIFQEEGNKENMENTCACSITLKVRGLGLRGLSSDIHSLLGPWPWCIHAQRGSFGNHIRGHILSYRDLEVSISNEPLRFYSRGYCPVNHTHKF